MAKRRAKTLIDGRILATGVAVAAAAFAVAVLPGDASGDRDGSARPAASSLPRDQGAPKASRTRIDVVIHLSDQRALAEWSSDRRTARRAAGVVAASKIFGARESAREDAVATLNRRSSTLARRSQASVARLVAAAGGRVTGALPAPNMVFARLPANRLESISRSGLIQAIEPAGRRSYLNYSVVHGTEGSWHAAGCTAAGAADSCPATTSPQSSTGPVNPLDGQGGPDVAIDDQGVNDHHEAFTGGPTPALGRTPSIVKPVGAPTTNGSLHANTIAAAIAVKDPAHRGNAYGVDKILDPVAPSYVPDVWMLGLPTFNDPGRPGATDLPESVNKSYYDDSQNALDDGYALIVADVQAVQYGIAQGIAAGNGGPYAYSGGSLRTCYDDSSSASGPCQYRVQHPCVAFNALCLGAATNEVDTVRAHDVVSDYSSRGPSVGGRKKPDLISMDAGGWGCPNGGYSGGPNATYDAQWKSGSICGEGTSYAAPFGASGQLLLAGVGVTAPAAQRAILINSALMLDSEGDGDSTAEAYWTPDVGWGEIDFAQAYADRGNWRTGQVDGSPANNARFFRVNGQSAGDRTTLAWNRRAFLTNPWNFSTVGYTASDLDLHQITLAGADDDQDVCGGSTTCGVDSSETTDSCAGFVAGAGAANVCSFAGDAVHKWKTTGDANDTTEQVRAAAGGDSLIKVRASSTVDGQAREDFAIASTEPLVPLATPTIAAPAPTLSDPSVAENENVTVTAFATNESSGADLVDGLDLAGATLTINLPAGVECVPSPCGVKSLGALATAETKSDSWTVRATTSTAHAITFTAAGGRFGENFSTTSTASTLTADSDAPAIDLIAPSGWQAAAENSVSWSATDPLSGVANVTVETSVDGGAFATVYDGGAANSSAPVTAPEGSTVSVRARATDAQGNVSAYQTESWQIDAEAPSLSLNAPASVIAGESASVFVSASNIGSPLATSYSVDGGPAQPLVASPILLTNLRSATTVEVTTTDGLGRQVTKSASIAALKRRVRTSLKIVRSEKSRRLKITVTPATAGSFRATIRCGRKKTTKRGRVKGGAALVRLSRGMGRCRISVRFTPSDTGVFTSASAVKVARL